MISSAPLLTPSTSSAPSRLRAITDRAGYDYLVSLPGEYAANSTRRWPLLLFLHGTTSQGTNVWDVTLQGLPRLLSTRTELTADEMAVGSEIAEAFIVIAPQCPPYEVWDDAALLALIDGVSGELRIDSARVYLTGLSMGAFGAWSLGIRQPQRFAALIPVCGGGRTADVATSAQRHGAALESLGVWAFHGAHDPVVPVEESRRMVDALQEAGVRDAKLTVFPEAQHDAWTAAYRNRELYRWLLRHTR
jgi:predicted peptidase